MIFWPLGRNFLRRSFLAFVIVSCLAKGYSPSLSLPSSWYSLSPSPRIARTTNAFALRRCELNNPLIDVTNPSPAPSPGLFNHDAVNWSGFPWLLPSLSLKLRSFSGTVPSSVSLWFWALNFFPCSRTNHQYFYCWNRVIKGVTFQNMWTLGLAVEEDINLFSNKKQKLPNTPLIFNIIIRRGYLPHQRECQTAKRVCHVW